MPTGLITKENIGFGGMSKSLGRPPEPFFSVQLKPLGSLGIDHDVVVYGDEATPDFMSTLEILWGQTEPVAWDALQTGWSWTWNIRKNQLAIKDAAGNISFRRVTTWSDLCVAAEVLESHQFIYYFDGGAFMDAFLIGQRDEGARPAGVSDICWGEFDRYLSFCCHALFQNLCDWGMTPADTFGTLAAYTYHAVDDLRTAITAKIADLTASSVWNQNALLNAKTLEGRAQKVPRTAMMSALEKYLMVSFLTASMLQADKHCYEPWMLWQMFQWLQRSTSFEMDDKIFDLSPNWGG